MPFIKKGMKMSKEHKAKLSKAKKGKKLSKEHSKKISLALKGKMPKNIEMIKGWNKGKHHTKKAKLKMSKAKKGCIPWNDGMEIDRKKYPTMGNLKPHTEESKKKMSKAKIGQIPWNKGLKLSQFSGENHPNWIKDRSLLKKKDERNDMAYKEWRYQVYKRDRHTCRINNQDCIKKVIAHHILPWRDFPELRYEVNNGITLCLAHHPRKRAEEKRLIPFFQGLVPVSNVIN